MNPYNNMLDIRLDETPEVRRAFARSRTHSCSSVLTRAHSYYVVFRRAQSGSVGLTHTSTPIQGLHSVMIPPGAYTKDKEFLKVVEIIQLMIILLALDTTHCYVGIKQKRETYQIPIS